MSAKKKDVLTTTDVATICRVSSRVVAKWCDNGDLEGYLLPKSKRSDKARPHRRFTRTAVEKFLAANGMPLSYMDILEDQD